MPVYKDKKGRYFIKTYVKDDFGNSKQITKRNKEWVGRKGKELAQQEEVRLKNKHKIKKKKNITENLTMEDAIKKYLEEQKKYNKESTYYERVSVIKNHIYKYFANKKINDITIDDILEWKRNIIDKHRSLNTNRKCYEVLLNIFDMGKYFGIEKNVVMLAGNFRVLKVEKEKIIKNKKIKYITFEDFNKFISVIDDPLWYTYFNLIYFTGMRKGEIQALTWKDVDFNNYKIRVNKTLTTKTNDATWKITSTKNLKNRTIDIDKNLTNILKQYFILKQQQSDFSKDDFVLGTSEPLKNHRIDNNKKKYFCLSGINEITNHEFRHSHVSLMINEYLKSGGTDVSKFFVIMSSRMGHTIKVMQETYLHFFPDVQQPVMNLIDCLNDKQGQKQGQNKFA